MNVSVLRRGTACWVHRFWICNCVVMPVVNTVDGSVYSHVTMLSIVPCQCTEGAKSWNDLRLHVTVWDSDDNDRLSLFNPACVVPHHCVCRLLRCCCECDKPHPFVYAVGVPSSFRCISMHFWK